MFTQALLPDGQRFPNQNRASTAVRSLMRKLSGARQRWHSARHLYAVNDNTLRDIGMHRSQIIAGVHGSKNMIRGGNDA